MFGVKESVLIVEASDVGKHSKLLYNLVGTSDDQGDQAVGPVDGSVDVSIFTEKQFADTPLSSLQKTVFIGAPKGADDYIAAIRSEDHDAFDRDGIYVGVSGKQACIQVAKDVPSKEAYWDFLKTAADYGQSFEDLLKNLRPKEADSGHEKKEGNLLVGVAKFLGNLPPVKAAADTANGVSQDITVRQKTDDIRDQMYRFAIKYFYLEKLKAFVEA